MTDEDLFIGNFSLEATKDTGTREAYKIRIRGLRGVEISPRTTGFQEVLQLIYEMSGQKLSTSTYCVKRVKDVTGFLASQADI